MDVETMDKICSFFTRKPYTTKYYLWPMIITMAVVHTFSFYGAYLWLTKAVLYTSLFYIFLFHFWGVGINIGAHRLWSHKSFKANLPLRIILMIANSAALQNDVITWARWHRCHHKWTDTNADPHCIKRGFFFAHMGWLMVRPHPEYIAKAASLDMGDLATDPVLKFQARYYSCLSAMCWLLTVVVPVVCWGEDPLTALRCLFTTYAVAMHSTFSVNSVVHSCIAGTKPYDHSISAVNLYLPMIQTMGEGYHNFHHAYPMDYRAAEYGSWFNLSLHIINFFAWIGWATHLKSTPLETVEKHKKKCKEFQSQKDH